MKIKSLFLIPLILFFFCGLLFSAYCLLPTAYSKNRVLPLLAGAYSEDCPPSIVYVSNGPDQVALLAEITPAYTVSGGDLVAPTLTSGTIPSAGTTMSLLFDENVSVGAGGNGGWAIVPGKTPTTAYKDPTGDDAHSGTWDDETNMYELVDDHPDDDGTDYLLHGTTTAGNATFTYTGNFTLPTGSTNISVQILYYAYAASGTQHIKGRLKVGGSYYNNDEAYNNPPAAYTLYTSSWTQNPKTTTAWTVNDINGVGDNTLQAMGIVSDDASPAIRLSSIRLQVTYSPPDTMTYASGSGSATLVYTLPWTANQGSTYTINYTQPGNGIEDAFGNDFASISENAVVNDSTQVTNGVIGTIAHTGSENITDGYHYRTSFTTTTAGDVRYGHVYIPASNTTVVVCLQLCSADGTKRLSGSSAAITNAEAHWENIDMGGTYVITAATSYLLVTRFGGSSGTIGDAADATCDVHYGGEANCGDNYVDGGSQHLETKLCILFNNVVGSPE